MNILQIKGYLDNVLWKFWINNIYSAMFTCGSNWCKEATYRYINMNNIVLEFKKLS